jgi:quinol monooxygenase YgiN
MWVRLSRLHANGGALDALIDQFKGDIAGKLKAIPGNTGAVLLVDRTLGNAVAISYWKDREALDASETQALGLRTGAATSTGATIDSVQRGEVLIMESTVKPEAGRHIRSIQFSIDPKQVDGGVAFMRSTVLQELKATDGFRALICGVDRLNALGFVTTVWQTRAQLDASDSKLGTLRQEALSKFGAGNVSIEVLESVYVDITAPVTT